MDQETIDRYNIKKTEITKLHKSLTPHELYAEISKQFPKGSSVLDVGCGTGRDCAWLAQNGFRPLGADASFGMLESAKLECPGVSFINDSLPNLLKIENETFDNVLCSAVIMHLQENDIALAISNLLRVVRKNGVVIITYRGSATFEIREDGKLYTPLKPAQIIEYIQNNSASILSHDQNIEQGRGHTWHNFIFRK